MVSKNSSNKKQQVKLHRRKAKDGEIFYHTALSKKMLCGAEYVVMPGDPGRVKLLAERMDPKAVFLATNREYTSYIVNIDGNKILICSSGIGGPATCIAAEELAMLGIKYFLRIGTCGTIQPHISVGDFIINTASIRLDGASRHYIPIEYPAVASFEFTEDIVNAARELKNIKYHIGVGASSDTFWPGQERYDNYSGYLLKNLRGALDEWRALNVLNFEMECASLFSICNAFGLHAASICCVVAQRSKSEKIILKSKSSVSDSLEKLAIAGLRKSLLRRKFIPKKWYLNF